VNAAAAAVPQSCTGLLAAAVAAAARLRCISQCLCLDKCYCDRSALSIWERSITEQSTSFAPVMMVTVMRLDGLLALVWQVAGEI
jgi:hypothetical protein